jgi:hypothetical protein
MQEADNGGVMRSAEIQGFCSPTTWLGKDFKGAPTSAGVYLFQLGEGKSIHRLKGESDIIYVGSTASGTGGLNKRLRSHNASRLLSLIRSEIGQVEVSWKVVLTRQKARFEEAEILWKYLHDHFELPPMNRQSSSLKGYKALRGLVEEKSMPREKKDALWEQLTQIAYFDSA